MPKVIKSQMSCGAQSSGLSCGMVVLARLRTPSKLEHEQDDQRHHEAEQASGLCKGEAEQKIGELRRGGGGVAQSALQIVTEDRADADAGADKRDRGEARADQFCC